MILLEPMKGEALAESWFQTVESDLVFYNRNPIGKIYLKDTAEAYYTARTIYIAGFDRDLSERNQFIEPLSYELYVWTQAKKHGYVIDTRQKGLYWESVNNKLELRLEKEHVKILKHI